MPERTVDPNTELLTLVANARLNAASGAAGGMEAIAAFALFAFCAASLAFDSVAFFNGPSVDVALVLVLAIALESVVLVASCRAVGGPPPTAKVEMSPPPTRADAVGGAPPVKGTTPVGSGLALNMDASG